MHDLNGRLQRISDLLPGDLAHRKAVSYGGLSKRKKVTRHAHRAAMVCHPSEPHPLNLFLVLLGLLLEEQGSAANQRAQLHVHGH